MRKHQPDSKTMREPAWMLKYQAREAIKNGRPEEAHRLLEGLVASGDRKSWALRGDVVRGYVDRAERALRQDDIEAAWKDLLRVSPLATPVDPGVARLREVLVKFALAEIRAMLEAGKPLQALEAISRLRERPGDSPALQPLDDAARNWQVAFDHADRGEFEQARPALAKVRPQLGPRTSGLDRYEEQLNVREDRFRTAWPCLQNAAVGSDWQEMLRCADEVLAVAPRHREAQQARNRAWQIIQPEAVKPTPQLSETVSFSRAPTPPPADPPPIPKRFFLWIDGVGAYLVCMGNRISIGQATSDGPVDVPLFADVSRIHAALTRDNECYLLEASKAVTLNGSASEKAVLQNGDRITLGNSCQMTFELPVPGGMSARLQLSGGRRLPMAVDAVLLMADMLILGNSEKSHVRIPDLEKPVYLVRQKDQLLIKWEGEFRIEGQKYEDRAPLPRAGTVIADPFTFAVEPVK
jgi:FHA domain